MLSSTAARSGGAIADYSFDPLLTSPEGNDMSPETATQPAEMEPTVLDTEPGFTPAELSDGAGGAARQKPAAAAAR